MSDPDPIEVLVEYQTPRTGHESVVLGPGETFEESDDSPSWVRVECRRAEDGGLEADGGRRFDAGEAPLTDDGWPARTDDGTEGIDRSQTVREAAQPVATMLRGCRRSDHCHRLAEAVIGAVRADQLGREDLLYPLRCHRDDGLVLRIEGGAQVNWMQYGAGDLFYWLTEDDRTLSNAIETNNLWEALQAHMIEVDPVLIGDTPHGDEKHD